MERDTLLLGGTRLFSSDGKHQDIQRGRFDDICDKNMDRYHFSSARKTEGQMNTGHDTQTFGYSPAQMDNFYQAFAAGRIKPTSVMNYLQHLFIAERCRSGQWLLDVCCGRGLQVPLLKYLVPTLGGYIGVDRASENLQEALEVIRYGGENVPFPYEFIQADVTSDLTKLHPGHLFDVVVYTSALEHMEKDAGIASLQQVYQVLHPQGVFYLSTPNTCGPAPKTSAPCSCLRMGTGRARTSARQHRFPRDCMLWVALTYGLFTDHFRSE